MKNSNILYLASSSISRQNILKSAKIDFKIIKQTSPEYCDLSLDFKKIVESIALCKMDHAILPEDFRDLKKGDEIFVLTADTMTRDAVGNIHGKPKDKLDAIKKIKLISGISETCTGFCLDKKVFDGKTWVTQERHVESVSSLCDFQITQDWYEKYFNNVDVLSCSGGLDITGYGEQFLKSVTGSYSAILGLPIFEVRKALEKLNYY